MIRGIRRRFMRIAIGVLALAMVLVAVIINGANWVNVRSELYETLGFLEEMQAQKGAMGPGPRGDLPTRRGNPSRHLRNMANESRFFSVTVGDDGSCALGDTTHVSEEDADSLVELATRALAGGRTSGFWGDYLFRVNGQSGERVALFLNCETKLTRVRLLALISAVACAGCVLLAWLLVGLFSSRAIRPLVESMMEGERPVFFGGKSISQFRRDMKSTLRKLGLPERTPHSCRHTFSRLCESYGVREADRKRMLGHSFGNDITNGVYGHRTLEELRTEIEKIKVPET